MKKSQQIDLNPDASAPLVELNYGDNVFNSNKGRLNY